MNRNWSLIENKFKTVQSPSQLSCRHDDRYKHRNSMPRLDDSNHRDCCNILVGQNSNRTHVDKHFSVVDNVCKYPGNTLHDDWKLVDPYESQKNLTKQFQTAKWTSCSKILLLIFHFFHLDNSKTHRSQFYTSIYRA